MLEKVLPAASIGLLGRWMSNDQISGDGA